MSRWLLPAAAGVVLGVVALIVVLTITGGEPTPGERADRLAAELRCPDCQGLSVADSPTRSAREMRRQIGELVDAGATDDEVRAHFTGRYGEWIRLAPGSPVLWLLPGALVLAGVAGLGAWLRSRPEGEARTTGAPTDDERRRIRGEVEALDG